MKKNILIIIIILMMSNITAKAKEVQKNNDDTNLNYTFTKEYTGVFSEKELEIINKNEILAYDNIAIEVKTKELYGLPIIEERIISNEEYENYEPPIETKSPCGTGCWETSAKRFTMVFSKTSYLNQYQIIVANEWKYIPKIKSYDTIAIRWNTYSGNLTYAMWKYNGYQRYYSNTTYNSIDYAFNGANSKYTNYGVGISMNIADNATDKLELLMFTYIGISGKGTVNVYGTYQHATSNITLANAKNYTFGNGLGNVLVYPTNIANKYDNMQGLHFKVIL